MFARFAADVVATRLGPYKLAELRIALGLAPASLDEREQKVVSLRFYGTFTAADR